MFKCIAIYQYVQLIFRRFSNCVAILNLQISHNSIHLVCIKNTYTKKIQHEKWTETASVLARAEYLTLNVCLFIFLSIINFKLNLLG